MERTSRVLSIQDYVAQFEMTRFLNDDLIKHLRLFHFAPYSHVYMEADEQDYLYFLVKGQVQCSHYHTNGKLAVFALSKPFAVIGDIEILREEKINSNVIATEDSILLGLSRPIVHRYGANDPQFLRFIIDQLSSKLYETNNLTVNQILPVVNRLVAYLLAQPINARGTITLPNKEDLASLLGTSTRHLNRVLRELNEIGHIQLNYPDIILIDERALQDINNT